MKITDYLSPLDVHRLLPEYSREDMVSITITIENEVIKKTKRDHRTVDAVFIKVSKIPGIQIFVLEPTKNDLRNSNFTLDESTHLTIHANGWIYSSTQIIFPKRPSHPIVYATLIGYELPKDQTTISFDPAQKKRRDIIAAEGRDPHAPNGRMINKVARFLWDESNYQIGEVRIDKKCRPVHMKVLNKYRDGKNTVYQLGILETNTYFLRCDFPLQEGCIFFDGSKEYLITDVEYWDFPCFPIITMVEWTGQKNVA